jgi:predicted dehydrogenase
VEVILGGEGSRVRRTGRGAEWYQASAQASGGGSMFEMGSHLIDQAFTICGVEEYEIEKCAQKAWGGLEFETSVQGKVALGNGRQVPFAFVVTRLSDVYNGIVVRCRNGELRIGLAPDGAVEICARNGTVTGRLEAPLRGRAALYAAFRAEWEEFVDACERSVAFADEDTGLLTTAFIAECFQPRALSRLPAVLEGRT